MVVENGSSGSAMYPWVEMLRLYCNMITLLLYNYCQILKLASWKFIYIHASTSSYFISYFSLFHHLSCLNNWLNWWSLFASIESSNFFSIKVYKRREYIFFPVNLPIHWKSQIYINLDHERNRVYFIQLPNLRRARQFHTIKKFSLRTDHKTATDA